MEQREPIVDGVRGEAPAVVGAEGAAVFRSDAAAPVRANGAAVPRDRIAPPQSSLLAEGLIGSPILKIAAEVRAAIAQGAKICNLTVGDFAPSEFPIPQLLSK